MTSRRAVGVEWMRTIYWTRTTPPCWSRWHIRCDSVFASGFSGRYLRDTVRSWPRRLRNRLLPRATQNLAEWRSFGPASHVTSPDEADAENAAALQRSLRRQGWQFRDVDAFIAVVALRYNLVLLTFRQRLRPVPI